MADQDTNATLAEFLGFKVRMKGGEFFATDADGLEYRAHNFKFCPCSSHETFARVQAEAIKRFDAAYAEALYDAVDGSSHHEMDAMLAVLSLPLAAKCAVIVKLYKQQVEREASAQRYLACRIDGTEGLAEKEAGR